MNNIPNPGPSYQPLSENKNNQSNPSLQSTQNKNNNRSVVQSQVSENLDTLFEISRLLNTGLTREQLTTCVQLLDMGISPEALAQVCQNYVL